MRLAVTILLVLLTPVITLAQHGGSEKPGATTRQVGAGKLARSWISTDAYPLDTCVVSGRRLGENLTRVEAAGRTFKLCSAACREVLAKDAPTYVAKLDQAVLALQLPDYPLDRCPISGRELGAKSKSVDVVLDNHLVRLCCGECRQKAEAKKAQIIADIEAAVYAKQRESYPLSTCVSSGDPLQPESTVEVVHGTTLLRLGSKECLQDLYRRPAALVNELRAARPKAPETKGAAKS